MYGDHGSKMYGDHDSESMGYSRVISGTLQATSSNARNARSPVFGGFKAHYFE